MFSGHESMWCYTLIFAVFVIQYGRQTTTQWSHHWKSEVQRHRVLVNYDAFETTMQPNELIKYDSADTNGQHILLTKYDSAETIKQSGLRIKYVFAATCCIIGINCWSTMIIIACFVLQTTHHVRSQQLISGVI